MLTSFANKWSRIYEPFNGHIKTAEQRTIMHQYGDWYIGRWWVGWYSLYSKEGPGRVVALCSLLLNSCYLMWHCNYRCQLKVKYAVNGFLSSENESYSVHTCERLEMHYSNVNKSCQNKIITRKTTKLWWLCQALQHRVTFHLLTPKHDLFMPLPTGQGIVSASLHHSRSFVFKILKSQVW